MAKGVKAVKRVTKKELKEDKLVTTYFKARQYFEEHQATMLKIAGGAVLIIALAAFWVMSKSRAESQASYELGMAILSSQTSAGDPVALTQQFLQIAERYSGTASGDDARYYLAKLKAQQHQPEEALKAYEDFLEHAGKASYLYPAALAGKASTLEDLGRPKEAAEYYLKAAEVRKNFFAEASFRLDAARCFLAAGEKDRAREQYQSVTAHYPKTAYSQKAEDGLARL